MCSNEQISLHALFFYISMDEEREKTEDNNERKEKKWKTHKRFPKIHDEMEMNVNNKI